MQIAGNSVKMHRMIGRRVVCSGRDLRVAKRFLGAKGRAGLFTRDPSRRETKERIVVLGVAEAEMQALGEVTSR